jgi:hypothetical protein
MGTVIFDISMSLDGYMTAAGRTPEEPMGRVDLEPVEVIETPVAIHQRFRVVGR